MAKFIKQKNRDYYNYSDGSKVEKKLLELSQSSYLKANNLSWPEYVHISEDRAFFYEDLLSFFDNPKVLEIGCGCGAITRKIAKYCSRLDAIESSFIRSKIAYGFCSKFKNVNIYNGLIQDFNANNKYDFVILNGVLEYAELFINKKTKIKKSGAKELIKKCINLLAPSGKIIIAIENKFGLKYLQGTKEDHTGIQFDGINGYTIENNNIKTFSLEEFEKLVPDDYHLETFIPFPDYKFPLAVTRGGNKWDRRLAGLAYSYNKDETIPYNCPNPWQGLAHYQMAKNSNYGSFSNSFIFSISSDKESIWTKNKMGIINSRSENNKKTIISKNNSIFLF